MAMNMILALLLVPSVLAFDASKFATKESMIDFASEIKGKSTESEHGILTTLLDKRANWHPEATALLQEVDKRDATVWRRLNGRRLVGSEVGGVTYCDGSTEVECLMQVDAQCKQCKWTSGGCDINTCGDHDTESACCANAMAVPTGCLWQKTSYGNSCVAATCENVIRDQNLTGAWSSTNKPTNAEKFAACNLQLACMGFCGGAAEDATCEPKVTGTTCTCPQVDPANGMPLEGQEMQECTKPDSDMTGQQAMQLLASALSGPSCTAMSCAKCLSGDSCDTKTSSITTDLGKCKEKCGGMAQCSAEVECMFCGPKGNNQTSCTPRVATVAASCGAVGAPFVDPPGTECINGDHACCGTICSNINTRCPSSCGDSYTCLDTDTTAGAVHTFGAAIAGIIGAVIGMLY